MNTIKIAAQSNASGTHRATYSRGWPDLSLGHTSTYTHWSQRRARASPPAMPSTTTLSTTPSGAGVPSLLPPSALADAPTLVAAVEALLEADDVASLVSVRASETHVVAFLSSFAPRAFFFSPQPLPSPFFFLGPPSL